MKKYFIYLTSILFFGVLLSLNSCQDDEIDTPVDPGTSTTDLLVKTFDVAPSLDGTIDDMWNTAQTLVGTAIVPDAGSRAGADFNNDGSAGPVGVFDPYTNESNEFKLRAGVKGDMIYFLLEWDDAEDSKDRQSWYFDANAGLWKGEHKYANDDNDKFYEDKFAFLWAATDVQGFEASTCYATCHTGLSLVNTTDKTARHYLNNAGEVVDMWHWKRVRCAVEPTVLDDQQMIYKDATGNSDVNGRTGDEGVAGYHGNSQTLQLDGTGTAVSVPLYVIPGETNYAYITKDQIDAGTAKMIVAVASDGTLTDEDGGLIDASDAAYAQGSGNKRIPSVWIENFTGSKADISTVAVHTGTGWIAEFSRELDTGNTDDVKFDITKDFPFGLALFNNAAIAHEIKTNLIMKFE